MQFSAQQEAALSAVSRWLKERSSQVLYLAGFAGTGKSTLARHFAEGVDGRVMFGSFTGKAAAVMRDKGCPDATTIHRMIYRARDKGTAKIRELREQLINATLEADRQRLETAIAEEAKALRCPSFSINPDSEVRGASLVIVDECSMVDRRIGEDLLSFGAPVLVLGDPAQLPPVGGGGYFTEREPDIMLTEVHRHAEASGILRLATKVRNNQTIDYCDFGDASVIRRRDIVPEEVPGFDQVLVGRNNTRRGTNRRIRELLGRESDMPQTGDRLVCLRNNHDLGLLNGDIWTAKTVEIIDEDLVGLTIENDSDMLTTIAWSSIFRGDELGQWDHDNEIQEFDYGYVLTAHKAQGSAWPRVMVFDESAVFGTNWRRWLYTAITRASEKVVVVR